MLKQSDNEITIEWSLSHKIVPIDPIDRTVVLVVIELHFLLQSFG